MNASARPDDCPHCGTSLAPPPQEHPEWCLVWELFGRLGQKDIEVDRLRAGIRRHRDATHWQWEVPTGDDADLYALLDDDRTEMT